MLSEIYSENWHYNENIEILTLSAYLQMARAPDSS